MSIFDRRPIRAPRPQPRDPDEAPRAADPLAVFGMLLAEALVPQPRDHALDVACAAGHVTFPLSLFIGSGGRVVGVDPSPEMLAEARRRKEKGGFDRVELYPMPSERLEFSSASFTLVTCGMALGAAARPEAVVAEMGRVLRPGGWIGITVAHPGAALFDELPAAPAPDSGVNLPAVPLPARRGLWDERAVAEMLMGTGFTATHVQVVRRTLIYRTVEEWWRAGAVTPNGPLPLLPAGRNPAPLPPDLAERMREQMRGAPLRAPFAVTLAVARKR